MKIQLFVAKHVWCVVEIAQKLYFTFIFYIVTRYSTVISNKERFSLGSLAEAHQEKHRNRWAPGGGARRGPAVVSDVLDRFGCQKYVLLCQKRIPIDVLLLNRLESHLKLSKCSCHTILGES